MLCRLVKTPALSSYACLTQFVVTDRVYFQQFFLEVEQQFPFDIVCYFSLPFYEL